MPMQDWTDVTPPEGAPGERDWGQLAHNTAVEHLQAIADAEMCAAGDCEEHGEEQAGACENPALGLGCNACDDCTVREVLMVSWPIIEAAIRSGDFDLESATKAS